MSSVVCSPLHSHTLHAPFVIFTSVSPLSYPSSHPSFQWKNPLLPTSPVIRSLPHRTLVLRAINIPAGNSSDPSRSFDRIVAPAKKLFNDLPQPVKIFPWARALESFFRLLFDLACAVAKYLFVPVLAVSSLSEMSYCGHERKLLLVPVPFLIGFVLASVLTDTITELSIGLKEGEFPSHLLLAAIFFLLLKLPGPFYPYWGRLLIPHFANGGLWRMVWLSFMWYRRDARTGILPVSNDRDSSS